MGKSDTDRKSHLEFYLQKALNEAEQADTVERLKDVIVSLIILVADVSDCEI